jgi:hypothetical protein
MAKEAQVKLSVKTMGTPKGFRAITEEGGIMASTPILQ